MQTRKNNSQFRMLAGGRFASILVCAALVMALMFQPTDVSSNLSISLVRDTIAGSTPYGSYRIIRTDTSFSGTVCNGALTVLGRYRADSLELRRIVRGLTQFNTKMMYHDPDSAWRVALHSISELANSLRRAGDNVERAGSPFPSGVVDFVVSMLASENDPIGDSPVPPMLIRAETFYGALTGSFIVMPGCIAIVLPAAITDFDSVKVYDLGVLTTISVGEPLDGNIKTGTMKIDGTAVVDGRVTALSSITLDGSILGASLDADAVDAKELRASGASLTVTRTLRSRASGFSEAIVQLERTSPTIGRLDADYVTISEGSLTVRENATVDSIRISSSSRLSVNQLLEAKKIRATGTSRVSAG